MNLTLKQLYSMLWAIRIATDSDQEFLACYTDRHIGKSIEPWLTERIRDRIKVWAALDKKICKEIKAIRA